MGIQEMFSDDEWFLLSSTPALIGAAMSSAASSGIIGTVKELSASMKATVAGLNDYPESELVQALLQKADNWDDAKEKISDYRERSSDKLEEAGIKSREQLHAQAMLDCREVSRLVDSKCSAEEAKSYKEWTLKIANNVASAASEGGFLGFGGERISPEEAEMLSKIEDALGVQSSTFFA